MSASPNPIETLRQRICRHLFFPDEDLDAIDFVLACYVSNQMPGDPLWGMLIDASGGGKTELLRALRGREPSFFLSKLTEKSLKSGYRDPKNPDKDPSLLPQLDGKVLIIKDLSPLLTMRRESRNVIIGDLRDAYDGFSDDAYGNIGPVGYEARFTVLAGSTLAVERFSAVDQELGERFIKFRARGNGNRSKVRRAIRNVGKDGGQREDIAEAIGEFLDSLPAKLPETIPERFEEPLVVLSDLIATARSAVPRDRNHALSYVPRPEVGTRLGKELAKLLLALAYVRGKPEPDSEDFALVIRVAEDCLHPNRLSVLRAAVDGSAVSNLPDSTVSNTRDDLRVLGVMDGHSGLGERWDDALKQIPQLFH